MHWGEFPYAMKTTTWKPSYQKFIKNCLVTLTANAKICEYAVLYGGKAFL